MGPLLLLDKSTLQALSASELDVFYRYHSLIVAPVLVSEILGDLKKPSQTGALTGTDVVRLSKKLSQMNLTVNAHYRNMIVNSLMGHDPTMDGRPNVPGGERVRTAEGKTGVVFKESPEERAFHRWRVGEFTSEEEELSLRWRESTRALDLNREKEVYRPFADILPETKSFSELVSVSRTLLQDPKVQRALLTQILLEFSFSQEFASEVFQRWEQSGFPPISEFAKYAFYCFHMNFSFCLGMARGYFGTRATNRVDLEYVYYAPFAMAFSSRDKFHNVFVPPFLREDQSYINGDELKADLRGIQSFHSTFSPSDLKAWHSKNDPYPPDYPGSITNALWKKHMVSRARYSRHARTDRTQIEPDSGDRISEISEGREVVPDSEEFDMEHVDFIEIERKITGEDPCPCRSGKKFKDCHLNEVEGKARAN